MNRTIGGVLDYSKLATAHRPPDRESLAREARRLAGQGLKPSDFAPAMGVTVEAARQLLEAEGRGA